MPSVEIELINELRKRVEELEKAVLSPIHYIEPQEPSPLEQMLEAQRKQIHEATCLPGHMIRSQATRPQADAVTHEEGSHWIPLMYNNHDFPQLPHNVFAIHFSDGWVWNRLVGWRYVGRL